MVSPSSIAVPNQPPQVSVPAMTSMPPITLPLLPTKTMSTSQTHQTTSTLNEDAITSITSLGVSPSHRTALETKVQQLLDDNTDCLLAKSRIISRRTVALLATCPEVKEPRRSDDMKKGAGNSFWLPIVRIGLRSSLEKDKTAFRLSQHLITRLQPLSITRKRNQSASSNATSRRRIYPPAKLQTSPMATHAQSSEPTDIVP